MREAEPFAVNVSKFCDKIKDTKAVLAFSIIRPKLLDELNKIKVTLGFPGDTGVKNPPANAGDTRNAGSVPGLGRSPGRGNSNPLQSSCLENVKARGVWQTTVHGVTKSLTRLSI